MSQQPPDRRPLVYALVAVLILGAAAILFWPRSHDEDVPTMVLTPDGSATGGAGPDVAGTSDVSLQDEHTPPSDTGPASMDDVAPETVPADRLARPSTTPAPLRHEGASPQSTTSPRSETATPPQPGEPSGGMQRGVVKGGPADAGIMPAPTSTGRYLLYAGSFQEHANAQRLVDRLRAKDVPAAVESSESAQLGTVYRVRVGYFQGESDAKAYGRYLHASFGLDSWVAQR